MGIHTLIQTMEWETRHMYLFSRLFVSMQTTTSNLEVDFAVYLVA